MGRSVLSGGGRGVLLWSEIEHERRLALLLFPAFVLGGSIYMTMLHVNGVVTVMKSRPTSQPPEWLTFIYHLAKSM